MIFKGIPDLTCSGMLDQASRFFHTLTRAQKESLHISNNSLFRGWEPDNYTYASASKDDPSQAEHKEAFNWGYEEALDPSGGDGQYVDLNGSSKPTNQWPDENALPGFYAGVREYYGQVLMLARHLFRLFALSLDLEERFFDSMTTHPGGIGRLVWYPALSDSEEKDQGGHTSGNDADDDTSSRLGLGAHTDYECFTLLLSSANPGLEILLSPSPATPDLHQPVWISCPVRPGTLTVNVADFLQRWTGGLYKSTVHRVVMRKRREERFSVPFFFSVNYDAKVGVLDLEGRDGTDRTEDKGKASEIRAGEWVLERLRATV